MPTWLHIRPKPLVIGGAIALIASVVGAFISHDTAQIGWHIGTIASAVAITFLLGLIPNRYLPAARIVFAALVGIGSIIVGVSYLQNLTSWNWSTGSLAHLGNRNSVGAGIALAGFTTFLLFPRLRIITAPVYLAILFVIGGRTPLVALFVGIVLVAGVQVFRRLPKAWWVPSLLVIGAAVALAITAPPKLHAWLTAYEASSKNQLVNFAEKYIDSWVAEDSSAEWLDDGPAMRVRTEGPVIIGQRVADVAGGQAIKAGLRVRSDTPVVLELSFGPATTTCNVTNEWTTCNTPEAVAATSGDMQWQLTAPAGTAVTAEVAEPFARVYAPGWLMGQECSVDCSNRIRTVKNTLKRFDVVGWAGDRNVTSRLEAQRIALQQFLKQPIAGWGLNQLLPAFKAEYPDRAGVDHAHNAMIDVLFERGLLGVLAVGALLVGTVRAIRPRTATVVFFFIFVLTLQAADSTFYFNLVYYPFWVALSLFRNPTVSSPDSAALADQTLA